MRRLAACLILSLALAAPATAQQGRITVVTPVSDAALRGPVSSRPTPVAEETPLLLPLPVQPTSIASTSAGGAQCRTSCSRQYYFCLAGEDERCPQHWSRCVSSCGS
jgi:hypothetical protein